MISAPREIFGLNAMELFVQELGRDRVCAMLDISETTLRRWLRGDGQVPRMASMALYWETSYGKSLIDTDQVNEIRMMYRQICILQDQFQRAREIVAGLRRLHSGTANEPIFEELENIGAFPLDSYGTAERMAVEAKLQAMTAPLTVATTQPSAAAKVAAALFDDMRRAASA